MIIPQHPANDFAIGDVLWTDAQDYGDGLGGLVLVGETNQQGGGCDCCHVVRKSTTVCVGNIFVSPSLLNDPLLRRNP